MVHVVVTRNHDGLLMLAKSDQQWSARYLSSCDCFQVRGTQWLRTYLSEDGMRSMCEYEAPFAQMVRDAFRETRMTFDRIWKANIEMIYAAPVHASAMPSLFLKPIIAEIDIPQISSLDTWVAMKQIMQTRLERQGIQQLWTIASTDGRQEIWGFDASCPNAIDLIHQAIDLPLKNVWRSQLLMPNL